MDIKGINKSIKIVENDVIRITKKFAENNLSKTCLKMADVVKDTHYEWGFEAGVHMLFFELPAIFNVNMMECVNNLSCYCPDYMSEMNINSKNYIKEFRKNYDKKIIFKES